MKKRNVAEVINNELCSGCGSCSSICGYQAINMNFTSVGRLQPIIDENKCKDCGLCLKACPGIDLAATLSPEQDPIVGHYIGVYCGESTDKKIFSNGQSGGMVTATLAYLFLHELIDAALVVTQSGRRAAYYVALSVEDLARSQTSQYTPVDLNNGLKLLKPYKKAAIVGLPCHIEGVKKIREVLPKAYSNIKYMLGLVCAGSLSNSLFDIVLKFSHHKQQDAEPTIYWRAKKYSSYAEAAITVCYPNGRKKFIDNRVRHFLKPYLTPPRCKLCHDKMNFFCDIVYGDIWGVSGFEKDKGGSILITRTIKGESLVRDLLQSEVTQLRPCTIEEIVTGQGLNHKYETICSSIATYKHLHLQVPGWAENKCYHLNKPDELTEKVITDYKVLETKNREQVVSKLYWKIKKELMVIRLKQFISSLIKH